MSESGFPLNDKMIRLREIETTLRGFLGGTFGSAIPGGRGGPVDHIARSLRAEHIQLVDEIRKLAK